MVPPIQSDWGKVQFLHIHCQWCSKWSPYIGWLGKSAISAPTLLQVLSDCWMVPCTVWLLKLPNFGPTLQLGHQMVPHTGWLLKWPHFGPTLSLGHWMVPCTGHSPFRLPGEKCSFCPILSFGYQMVHHTGWLVKRAVLCPNFPVGQQMAPIQSWLFGCIFPVVMKWAI